MEKHNTENIMDKASTAKKYNVIFLFFAIAIIVSFIAFIPSKSDYVAFNKNDQLYFGDDWQLDDGTFVSTDSNLVNYQGQNGYIILKKTVPDSIHTASSLNFRSRNLSYILFLDGIETDSFLPEISRLSGVSYGSSFHHIPLPDNSAGKEITLKLKYLYPDKNCYIDMLYIGDSSTFSVEFIRDHMLAFIVSLLIILFGIVSFILAAVSKNSISNSFVYLGMIGILTGLLTLSETLFMQFMVGNSEFWHSLSYLAQMLLPYPGFCYVNCILMKPNEKYNAIVFDIICVMTSFCIILTSFGIADYHSLLPFIHLIDGAITAVIVIMLVKDAIRYKKEQKKNPNIYVYISFAIFSLATVLDVCLYDFGHKHHTSDANRFTRIGLLFFIIILIIKSISLMMENIRKSNEFEIVNRIAYVDALTELGNRAAFIKYESSLFEKIANEEIPGVRIGMFDLNCLKTVNDNNGHTAGDMYIKGAATALQNAFGKDCSFFRTGGDEFVVIMEGSESYTEKYFDESIKRLEKEETEFDKNSEMDVSMYIAVGNAYAGNDISITDAEKKADSLMYENKKQYKLKHGQVLR